MSRQQIARLSLNKTIYGHPVAVRDGEDQIIADTEASHLPFSCAESIQDSRMDSIFVVFPRTYGDGYSGMKIGNLSCQPTLVKKMAINNTFEKKDLMQQTSHPNLVNLTDVSVNKDRIYFSYKRTKASLTELLPFIRGNEITVASIYKKILHSLIYIHEVLNTNHGDLKCDNIHISEDSEVKIRNIKESLIQLGNTGESARDVEAIYKIAATLLGTSSSSSIVNVSGLMANHFTNLPNNISPQDVLKHPFFRISQDSWYLSHLGVIHSFVARTHAQMKPGSHEEAAEEGREEHV